MTPQEESQFSFSIDLSSDDYKDKKTLYINEFNRLCDEHITSKEFSLYDICLLGSIAATNLVLANKLTMREALFISQHAAVHLTLHYVHEV